MNTVIKFRNFNFPEDLDALVNLKNDYFEHYNIDRITDIEKQKGLLSYPNHNAEKDNFVAELSGEILAHIWTWEQSPHNFLYDLHVHPDYERQRLGSNLMALAIEHIKEKGGHYIDTQVSLSNIAHIQFCQKMGFQPLGRYLHLALENDVKIPSIKLSDGFTIRQYSDINDIEIYTDAMNQSYGDLWGHMANASTDLVAQSLNYYDASWIFIMFSPNSDLAGFGRIFLDKQNKIYRVDAPGVLPAYRSPQRYQDLLLYSLNQLQSKMTESHSITSDSWGDFDSTLHLFWELGFKSRAHKIGYRLYI